jgi:hypothetical protein
MAHAPMFLERRNCFLMLCGIVDYFCVLLLRRMGLRQSDVGRR